MVVGHASQLAQLSANLPPVSLLVGPDSVGKTAIAFAVCLVHEVTGPDRLYRRSLTVEEARAIVRLASLAPLGPLRVCIVDLDGSSVAAQTALLKALEEAPTTTRFILVASEMPHETIVSRAQLFRFSLLSDAEVEKILLERRFKPGDAARLAPLGRGQVSTAIQHFQDSDTKMTILSVVRCLTERDEEGLSSLASKWTDEHTDLLAQMCREIITRNWKMFQHAEVDTIPSRQALQILTALRASIRPRLVVNAALMTILKGT